MSSKTITPMVNNSKSPRTILEDLCARAIVFVFLPYAGKRSHGTSSESRIVTKPEDSEKCSSKTSIDSTMAALLPGWETTRRYATNCTLALKAVVLGCGPLLVTAACVVLFKAVGGGVAGNNNRPLSNPRGEAQQRLGEQAERENQENLQQYISSISYRQRRIKRNLLSAGELDSVSQLVSCMVADAKSDGMACAADASASASAPASVSVSASKQYKDWSHFIQSVNMKHQQGNVDLEELSSTDVLTRSDDMVKNVTLRNVNVRVPRIELLAPRDTSQLFGEFGLRHADIDDTEETDPKRQKIAEDVGLGSDLDHQLKSDSKAAAASADGIGDSQDLETGEEDEINIMDNSSDLDLEFGEIPPEPMPLPLEEDDGIDPSLLGYEHPAAAPDSSSARYKSVQSAIAKQAPGGCFDKNYDGDTGSGLQREDSTTGAQCGKTGPASSPEANAGGFE
ncbi:hypothetical protein GGI15_002496 [Coemansia interrupta]|uniref:Uncharacterized protein n=1 Tax=Coemansia interrupta TaxID=1126814 RepID=A0A9W8LL70_9FUNG|nr:hypothetical protein GGI15_002496 [Coemansia interrupta]